MQISKIQTKIQLSSYQNKNEVKKNEYPAVPNGLKAYPKGYRPYFGARLFRTPENFYEQEFNKNGMPDTMRNCLYKNYEVNSKKPPAQLHKEAFEDLVYCESIEDVKEMFPDEPLFKDIKTLETIRPTGGYLYQMRAYGLGNKDVLQSGEDLTVYLLKKIFYECKDLDEINADFDKDRKLDLERDNDYCNEGAYFLHSTLKSIGIKLPDKAYWKSLQANRTDKEYTPYTFVLTKPRKKPEYTKPRVRKPLHLSPEEIQRRRELMINRWIDMTPAQRQAQLAKMKEGQENSIMYQYMPQIMLIATDRAHFQDKMYQFFRENKDKIGADAPDDIDNQTPKQAKGMKMFWEQNSKIRKSFIYYVKSTIGEFERAKEQDENALNALLTKAENIKERNMEKALIRKLVNAEATKEELKDIMQDQIFPFPDVYGDKYVKYVMNHSMFKNRIIPLHVKTKLAKTDEERKKYLDTTISTMTGIFNEFNKKYKKDGISATMALATIMMPFMEVIASQTTKRGLSSLAQGMLDDSDQMLTGNPSCILSMVEKYADFGSKKVIENLKDNVNSAMKEFSKGLSDEELKAATKEIINYMGSIVNNFGNYKMLSNYEIRKRCAEKLPKVYRDIERNKDSRRYFIEFLKNYEGMLKFRKEIVDSYIKAALSKPDSLVFGKTLRYKCIQDYLFESIIDDYLANK